MLRLFIPFLSLLFPFLLSAQTDWPRVITGADGSTIRVYQPQPDSLDGNILKFRAAFALTKKDRTEPDYGSIVVTNVIETDRNKRTLSLLASNVLSLRYSEVLSADKIDQLKETIECGLPGIGTDISLDQVVAFMDGQLKTQERPGIGLIWMRQGIDYINAQGDEHTDTLREGNAGIRDVVVSTGPAELIQTRGKPVFSSVAGTTLRYVTNTNNDIFLDTSSRLYYVLLSGRWFSSRQLTGQWTYIPSDSLPSGFMEIPEGSPEDRVLSCVAGTPAAREALMDAQIPQTARVSRAAAVKVNFDGPPKFEAIRGTHLQYAINAVIPVFYTGTKYYCIDKAVWFAADKISGPWHVSPDRPAEVYLIPADCPVYNCKYVYVYGTGYYYPSWTDHISCPRPWTYGFNMWLNPWLGWTLGYDFSLDWFNTGVAWDEGYWNNGWWGPTDYRPPYIWHHFSGHGLYAMNARHLAGSSYNNNIYTLRPDVYTRPRPAEIFTDRLGNIYRLEGPGSWSQRQGDIWQNIDTSQKAVLFSVHQLEMCRERGNMRIRDFRQAEVNTGLSTELAGAPGN